MSRFLLLLLIFINCVSLLGQDTVATEIKEKHFKGYIFPKTYEFVAFKLIDIKARYSPTIDDIKKVELILKENIDNLIGETNGKIKSKNLKKYTRQYLGYINSKGEVIIYINLIYTKNIDKGRIPKFKEELQLVLDGGDDYWSIYVNIIEKRLFGLHINGTS